MSYVRLIIIGDFLNSGSTYFGQSRLEVVKVNDEAVKIDKFPRYTDLVKYEGSIYFLREHLGFGNEHVIVDDGTVGAETEVQLMPTYPNDGAIAVIDGKVIVKLGYGGSADDA